MSKVDEEVRGIRMADLYRWQAELRALAAAAQDEERIQQSIRLHGIANEFAVIACPEEDDA